MSEASPQSNDLAPGPTHWLASATHPVPPAAGSYVLVDGEPVLAATAPGPIVAVLVLPGGDPSIRQPDVTTGPTWLSGPGRPAAPPSGQ